jgi:endonuclease YncB( thermonuclease family)
VHCRGEVTHSSPERCDSTRLPHHVGMRMPIHTLLLAVAVAWLSPVTAQERTILEGVVVGVVDGDTADIRLASAMIRVRLHAVDAPERGQPYGEAAKEALSRLAFGKAVDVEPVEQDRYDRLVARLWVGDVDVNAEMVTQGYAWVYRRYADEAAYCAYEKAARDLRRGLWSLPPEQRAAPWEWRKRKTLEGRFTDYSNQSEAACAASLGK